MTMLGVLKVASEFNQTVRKVLHQGQGVIRYLITPVILGVLSVGALPAHAQFGDLLNKVKEAAEEASDSVTETAKQLIPSEKPEEKQATTVVATPGAAASNCPEPERYQGSPNGLFASCWKKQQYDWAAAVRVYEAKWAEEFAEEKQREAEERAERDRLAALEKKLAAEEKKLAAEKREEQREYERLAAEKRDPNCEEQRLAFTESASVSGLVGGETQGSTEFGAESGLWCEWRQSESVEQCTKDVATCFRYSGTDKYVSGIPFSAKGFSAQMSFENFVAKAESLAGKPITQPRPLPEKCDIDNFLGSDAKMTDAFMRIARDEDCRTATDQWLAPGEWADKEQETITLSGFTLVKKQYKHRKKIAYSFEGQEPTLGGLPIKYAYYNYVEKTEPMNDPDEKSILMTRYVSIAMQGGEEDIRPLMDVLGDKFYQTAWTASGAKYDWLLVPPSYQAFDPRVDFLTRLQLKSDFVILTFSQRETYTRPPETSRVKAEDL